MSGDICSSSNGLLPLCHHHGKIRRPLLHAPRHPEELCGAPLDAAQHPEELCRIDNLDLFREHSSDSWSVWTIATYSTTARRERLIIFAGHGRPGVCARVHLHGLVPKLPLSGNQTNPNRNVHVGDGEFPLCCVWRLSKFNPYPVPVLTSSDNEWWFPFVCHRQAY